MSQQIIDIKISELHLWTENPRDPINLNLSDEDIISRAINQKNEKWNLPKLIDKMGDYYDFSELPTVVRKNDKYIVYDGNRRLAVIKYSQNPDWSGKIENKLFSSVPQSFRNMDKIFCNLCDETTALTNIERKHTDSGTWGELERSYFLNVHRNEKKSNFLILEESTGGIISKNKKMNQRFVHDEVFTKENLMNIGFKIEGGKLWTNYDENKTKFIFDKVVELIHEGIISTRGENRKKLLEPLQKNNPNLKLESYDDTKSINEVNIREDSSENKTNRSEKKNKRTVKRDPSIFGKSLVLKQGDVNNIYRDIVDLYRFYLQKKNSLSENFHILIRMSLRLLVETAGLNSVIDDYINKYFDDAKEAMSKDEKTTLSTQSIGGEKDIIILLHIGAHDYTASKNLAQTLAISIIIGAMLELSHSEI